MGELSPVLWPLIDIFLCSYIELIFRGGVSCLPAALLFSIFFPFLHKTFHFRMYPYFYPFGIFCALSNDCNYKNDKTFDGKCSAF